MIDLKPTIVAKSDQQNADDYLGGPRTIRITRVALTDAADQPIAVHFEGDDGKPYKPCKSMRRVMVHVWGDDGHAYIGRSLTLYRDPEVKFGGDAVGGLRISHMSHIERVVVVPIMVTRGKRKPYEVRPLVAEKREPTTPAVNIEAALSAGREAAAQGSASLVSWWKGLAPPLQKAAKPTLDSELKPLAAQADAAAQEGADDAGADFGDMPGGSLPVGMKTGAQLLAEQTADQDRPSLNLTPGASDELLDQAESFKRGLMQLDTAEEVTGARDGLTSYAWFEQLQAADGEAARAVLDACTARSNEVTGGARG